MPDPKSIRPSRRWYWVGGSLMPAAIVFMVVVLTLTEWFEVPAWVGVLTVLVLVLAIFATFGIVLGVFITRSTRLARLNAVRHQAIIAAEQARFGFRPMPAPPPRAPATPAKDRRPRRRWFFLVPLIPPAFVGVGLLLFHLFGGGLSGPERTPELVSDVVEGSGSTEFYVQPENVGELGLYASPSELHVGNCAIDGPEYPRITEREVGHGWDDWRLEYSVNVHTSGLYTLTCDGALEQSHVIAETRTAHEADRRGMLLALTVLGTILLGVVTMIATLVTLVIRRATYTERMARRARGAAVRNG